MANGNGQVNRKTTYGILAVIVVAALVSWRIHQMSRAEAKARVVTCLDNFRCIGVALKNYRDQNNGTYPSNLQSLYPKYLDDVKKFHCPADFSITSTTTSGMSYTYFKPENPTNAIQIIVRDKQGNHKGMHGSAVLYANGAYEWIEEE